MQNTRPRRAAAIAADAKTKLYVDVLGLNTKEEDDDDDSVHEVEFDPTKPDDIGFEAKHFDGESDEDPDPESDDEHTDKPAKSKALKKYDSENEDDDGESIGSWVVDDNEIEHVDNEDDDNDDDDEDSDGDSDDDEHYEIDLKSITDDDLEIIAGAASTLQYQINNISDTDDTFRVSNELKTALLGCVNPVNVIITFPNVSPDITSGVQKEVVNACTTVSKELHAMFADSDIIMPPVTDLAFILGSGESALRLDDHVVCEEYSDILSYLVVGSAVKNSKRGRDEFEDDDDDDDENVSKRVNIGDEEL